VPLSGQVTCLTPAITRCFSLKCNEGYLLIDVPYPGNYESSCECLEEGGIDISDIKYLLLTHHHDDHVGCVNELVRDTDIILTGDDDGLLAGIGIDGKIIHTPGHTPDPISVILTDGSAIVGDAAMNFMEFCRTRHRPTYMNDLEETYQSWEKLREHGAQVIYPSRGDPFAAEELVPVG
jgi:glyoxylase-like metal-dependent hydrolase (beta-lactamase superfamily II)